MPLRPPIPGSIAEAENAIRFQAYETAHVFGLDGSYRFGRNGDGDGITLDDDEALQIADSVFIHNHPQGKRFSRPDIRFIRYLNPADFRAITARHRFRLVRPENGWPDTLFDVYERAFRTAYLRHRKDYDRGKINEAALDERTYADAIKRTVRALGLEYTEEEL